MPAAKPSEIGPLEGVQLYCPKCLRWLAMPVMDPATATEPREYRCRCGAHGWAQFHRRQVIPFAAFPLDDAAPKVITMVKK